ncbi:hypothetical protein VTO42DRAFT_151 [Malbranchea cinnamomea]
MSPHAEIAVPSGTNNWWKESIVYQVYPASFADSNGDGWGDIPGLISKIPYLKSLGVDVVWLSPMYDSPMHDMGYDIRDYQKVLPAYGTVEDVERLVERCHEAGMKVILDLVVNHTSDEHEWFKESRRSKDSEKRDWYFWRKPRYDKDGNRLPPSNYRGYFAGSTWTYDEQTGEYYLHLYAPQQPDLNWDNPSTRQAIYDSAIRFWLDRGVDGFRVDTVNKYSKVTSFPDAPITDPKSYIQPAVEMWCNGPRIHEFIREMHDVMASYGDVMTVGELGSTPDPAQALPYVRSASKELSMVLHLDVGHMGKGKNLEDKYDYKPWKLTEWKAVINKWQTFIQGTDAWTSAFTENHDSGRSVSRYGSEDPRFRALSAKMLAIMLLCMTGTVYLYQGQEIGMLNAPRDWPIEEEYKDVEGLGYYREAEAQTASGKDPTRKERIANGLRILGRDHARLPMSWDDSPHGGFTTQDAKPWMRPHDLYPEINVKKQEGDPTSVLEFYKKMIQLRREHRELFVHGAFAVQDFENEDSFCFTKTRDDLAIKAVVALSFRDVDQPFTLAREVEGMQLIICNYDGEVPAETLRPFEGRVYIGKMNA